MPVKSASSGPARIVNDRYELLSVLNQGSFGVVRLVRDIKTDSIYAAKFIRVNSPDIGDERSQGGEQSANSHTQRSTVETGSGLCESECQSQCQRPLQSQSRSTCTRTSTSTSTSTSEFNNTSAYTCGTEAVSFASNFAEARHEIKIHEILGTHPNITSLVDHFNTPEGFYLILDYCDGGDLYEAINRTEVLTSSRVRDIMMQLIDAVHYCHSKGVYHRDIKPENILLTNDGTVKLADWGLASTNRMCSDFGVGSKRYMAPECFDERPPTYDAAQADIWAVGICLLNALFGRNPFKIATQKDRIFTDFATDRENLFDVFPALSRDVFRALRYALTIDPENRSLEDFKNALSSVRVWTTDDEYDLLDEEDELGNDLHSECPSPMPVGENTFLQSLSIPISATTDERPPLRVPTAVAMSLSPVTIWDRREQFTPPMAHTRRYGGFSLGGLAEEASEDSVNGESCESSSQRDRQSVNSSQLSDTELYGDEHDIFNMDDIGSGLSRMEINETVPSSTMRKAFVSKLSNNRQSPPQHAQSRLHKIAVSPPSLTTDTQSEDSKEFLIPSKIRAMPFELPEKEAVLSWADDEDGLDEIFTKHRALRI